MTSSQTVPELIAAAQATAKTSEDLIAQMRGLADAQSATDAQREQLRNATVALELTAVDTFTMFEARMQRHFKRGPFSRKLKAALLEAGHKDLAGRVHAYYLAINVLKHGKGASYRELLAAPSAFFQVTEVGKDAEAEEGAPSSFINISAAGFFDGLATTLIEAHDFLEAR